MSLEKAKSGRESVLLSDKNQLSVDILNSIQNSLVFGLSKTGNLFCMSSKKEYLSNDFLEAVDFLVDNLKSQSPLGRQAIQEIPKIVEVQASFERDKSKRRPVVLKLDRDKILPIMVLAYRMSRSQQNNK